ncbi:MAG: hypothetical protein FWD48_05335 [Oscillospiraceae bacterium]|nr:hypothetical protein [Oscillospiraceae bacterium]
MKKLIASVLILLIFLPYATAFSSAGAQSAGDGTAANPFVVHNEADLRAVGRGRAHNGSTWGLNHHYRMMANITLTGDNWTPIGGSFTGGFDGFGYAISNMIVTGGDGRGMFNEIGSGGMVRNVGIYGSVSGNSRVGGVAGGNSGLILDCYFNGDIVGTGQHIGGIAGQNRAGGIVENCYAKGTVTATNHDAGGIVGFTNSGGSTRIENCAALQTSINGNSVNRITGGTARNNNFASAEMLVNGSRITTGTRDNQHGENITNDNIEEVERILAGASRIFDINGFVTMHGQGTQANPFRVTQENIRHFNTYANTTNGLSAHYVLMENVTLGSGNWTSIGTAAAPFRGSFDGKRHTISNININLGGTSGVGFFGHTVNALIANLGLVNINIRASDDIGGLVGISGTGTVIRNCFVTGTITRWQTWNANAGGIVGLNNGIIENCFAEVTVSGGNRTGGIAGTHAGGAIFNTVALTESLLVANNGIGRIYGELRNNAEVLNNYAFAGMLLNSSKVTDGALNNRHGADISDANVLLVQAILNTASASPPNVNDYIFADGSKNNPFLIRNEADLRAVGRGGMRDGGVWGLDGNYVLMADITLRDGNWTAIGTSAAPFTGEFNGNRHTISNMNINIGGSEQGFFGVIRNAVVENLGLINVNISAISNTGGIAGVSEADSIIRNCFVTGTVEGRVDWSVNIGGITGFNNGIIENCYTTATVISGSARGGGIAGTHADGSIRNTVVLSLSIDVANSDIGRIFGDHRNNAEAFNNYALDDVLLNGEFVTDGTSTNRHGEDIFTGNAWAAQMILTSASDNPPDLRDYGIEFPLTLEELIELIEDAYWLVVDLEWKINRGVQPEVLERAEDENIPFESIRNFYFDGFEIFGADWDKMFSDKVFRDASIGSSRSGNAELIDEYYFNFYENIIGTWGVNRAVPDYSRQMSELESYNRELLLELRRELTELRTQISQWEIELYILEEREFLEIFEKEVERDGWLVNHFKWEAESLKELFSLSSRYEYKPFEMLETMYAQNLRAFGEDWEFILNNESFRDDVSLRALIWGSEYNKNLWNAYSDYNALFVIIGEYAEMVNAAVLPLEYEYNLAKLPYLHLLMRLNDFYEQRGDEINPAENIFLLLDSYRAELFILRYEIRDTEKLLEEVEKKALAGYEWLESNLTFRELDSLFNYRDGFDSHYSNGGFEKNRTLRYDEVIRQYDEYIITIARIDELKEPITGKLDRIDELEELIRRLTRGIEYRKAIYEQILELVAILDEAAEAAGPYFNKIYSFHAGMISSLENALETYESYLPNAIDEEDKKEFEEAVRILRGALNIYRDYPEQLVSLLWELLDDYIEECAFAGLEGQIYLDALEKYLPFLSFEEMLGLYYAVYIKGYTDTYGYLIFRGGGDSFRMTMLSNDFLEISFAIRGYLFSYVVDKHDRGNVLIGDELAWYGFYLSQFPVTPTLPDAEYLNNLPYHVNVALLTFAESLIGFFEIAAGTAVMSYNGTPMKLFDAFFRAPAIAAAFWGIFIIALALAVFFSIIAVTRHAGDLKAEKSMGAILTQIGKTMLMLLIIPAVIIGSVQLVSTVMEQTDRLFQMANGTDSVTKAVFAMSTLNAGIGEKEGSSGSINAPIRQKFLTGELDYKNQQQVGRYFRLNDIDIGMSVMVSVILIIMYIALICIFILRIFYLILLYIISPLFVSSMVLDDGMLFRKWRDLFISKLLTGFALVISVKMLVYIVPPVLTGGIRFGPDGFASVIIKFLFIVGSVYAVLASGGMITKIIYPEGEADEDMVIGEMKEKALWAANKAKEAAKAAVELAVNTGKLLISGDASGLVKQAAQTAKKAAEAAAGAAKQVVEGGDKNQK